MILNYSETALSDLGRKLLTSVYEWVSLSRLAGFLGRRGGVSPSPTWNWFCPDRVSELQQMWPSSAGVFPAVTTVSPRPYQQQFASKTDYVIVSILVLYRSSLPVTIVYELDSNIIIFFFCANSLDFVQTIRCMTNGAFWWLKSEEAEA